MAFPVSLLQPHQQVQEEVSASRLTNLVELHWFCQEEWLKFKRINSGLWMAIKSTQLMWKWQSDLYPNVRILYILNPADLAMDALSIPKQNSSICWWRFSVIQVIVILSFIVGNRTCFSFLKTKVFVCFGVSVMKSDGTRRELFPVLFHQRVGLNEFVAEAALKLVQRFVEKVTGTVSSEPTTDPPICMSPQWQHLSHQCRLERIGACSSWSPPPSLLSSPCSAAGGTPDTT